ncbi:hypothetical protein FQZ97_658480 [compost metagenome]
MRLGQPAREQADGGARFDAQLVRAEQHRARLRQVEAGRALLRIGGIDERAGLGHRRAQEGFEHGMRLGTVGREPEVAVHDVDAGLRRNGLPHVARMHGAAPHVARRLTGDGDEAEVADRCAQARGIALDHAHAQAALRGGVRMGQADDSGADHDHIEAVDGHAGVHQRCLQACVRFSAQCPASANRPRPTAAVSMMSEAMAAAGATSPASSMLSTAMAASVVCGE